jgi:hypothetical protein
MKAMPRVKSIFFKTIFLLLILVFVSSCKKNYSIETSLKNETFTKNHKEEIEAFFFIAAANVSQSIISKSQIAQQKSSDSTILEISKKIEINQNLLLQEITNLANKKLIIITEINATRKRDLYDLIDANEYNFNHAYLDSMNDSLEEQIRLLESISKETNDQTILKMVLQYLPQQYEFSREIQKSKIVI